jgi:hypothetical protein
MDGCHFFAAEGDMGEGAWGSVGSGGSWVSEGDAWIGLVVLVACYIAWLYFLDSRDKIISCYGIAINLNRRGIRGNHVQKERGNLNGLG